MSRFRLDDDDVRTLGERGWLVRPALLGDDLARAVFEEARQLRSSGAMRPAGHGRGAARRVDAQTRGDSILWYEPASPGLFPDGALRSLWEVFEEVRVRINEAASLGLERFDVQVACYPGDGAAYARHVDVFQGGAFQDGAFRDGASARRLTAIVYLNPTWTTEHGGCLRIHAPDGPVDIEPVLDRAVLMRSDRVEHEVLPAWAPRYAATAWFEGPRQLPGAWAGR